jgi:hypothetical protein
MDDAQIAAEIDELEAEEQKLRQEEEAAGAAGRSDVLDADRKRLGEIASRLAQLNDLQRQRTALRDAGGDPDDAEMRDAKTVEGYLG